MSAKINIALLQILPYKSAKKIWKKAYGTAKRQRSWAPILLYSRKCGTTDTVSPMTRKIFFPKGYDFRQLTQAQLNVVI